MNGEGDFETPGGQDGRDEPIRSIEDYDESQFGIGASPSLRGGSHIQENADVAEEDRNDNDELEPSINMDDYYESEDNFDDEYDVASEDLTGYRVERTKVKGIATWPEEVARAHKTLALRGAYSLIPSTWNWDLIDHPFVEGLFAPANSNKKVLFKEQSNRSRGMSFHNPYHGALADSLQPQERCETYLSCTFVSAPTAKMAFMTRLQT